MAREKNPENKLFISLRFSEEEKQLLDTFFTAKGMRWGKSSYLKDRILDFARGYLKKIAEENNNANQVKKS